MKIEGIFANNTELTPAIEKYMRSRIEKLSKIVQNMDPATIRAEIGKPSTRPRKGGDVFYAELHATIQDKDFRANKTDLNVYKAIEKVKSDMHQQIIRWKKKEQTTQRKKGMLLKKQLRSDHFYK